VLGSAARGSRLAALPLLAALCGVSMGACGVQQHEAGSAHTDASLAPAGARVAQVTVPPRTPQIAAFPCVEQCHKDRKPNPEKRPLKEFHSLKHIEHGDTTFWCNFCHNDDNLDSLRLLDGRLATFDEAYRLCGECHGDKRRDWQAGIHGLQTGGWDGRRETVRRSCTACHDPHAPRRPSFQALPPPMRPRGEK
jgi:hypothetical protein